MLVGQFVILTLNFFFSLNQIVLIVLNMTIPLSFQEPTAIKRCGYKAQTNLYVFMLPRILWNSVGHLQCRIFKVLLLQLMLLKRIKFKAIR